MLATSSFSTASYNYPGVFGQGGAPATGSGIPYIGRGPVDAYIIGSNTVLSAALVGSNIVLSATVTTPDEVTDVEVKTLSGTEFSNTSSFSGTNWHIAFGPEDVSIYGNLAITVVNNAPHNLESGSIEWSPNSSNWETDWDTSTLAALTSSGVTSMQISANSRRYLRVRAISSGATGDITGSLDIYVHVNTG